MDNDEVQTLHANGNMTLRREVSGTETFDYTQTWTADNRLQSVIKTDITGTVLAVTQYAYDGDGVRVRKSDPSGTKLYIGLTEVTLAYTPPAGMGNTGVSADGFDLRKRGATVGWDAGVFDGQHAITQTGFAQVRVETKYSGYRLFGLTTSDIGGGFCPTRYGLELVHGGTLEIYENCVRVAYPPALVYGAGDQLRIEADAGVVRYKRQVAGAGNWQVLYTSTLPVTAALYFNASLYTPGSTPAFAGAGSGAPSVNRTYYTFGGARVAMRDGAGAALVYLHGDQLGSASLATSMTGTVVSQQRYAPYGEVRWSSGAGMPTDFTFTSQRASSYGTIIMSAREYLPSLGRFLSADSIVPGAGNPQALNRYAYVFNSPLGFVDPSGHDPLDAAWEAAWRASNCPTGNPSCTISDEARQYRLYSVTYAGPVSHGRSWTQADWEYMSANHNAEYADRSERTGLVDFRDALQRLASYYLPGEKQQFVSGIALLYAGWPYDPTGNNIRDVGANFEQHRVWRGHTGWPSHGMLGFDPAFFERPPNDENTHHWAGNLIFAFNVGRFGNWFVAIAREAGSCISGRDECRSDVNMGQMAGHSAAWLHADEHSIRDFADQVFEALRVK